MTEVSVEVGYRSYIRILRKKWDIVYHGKDLYFSHANKILIPHYDMTTKEYYGVETNPTRLAIVKFIDQYRDGPGLYPVDYFTDLLQPSKNYVRRSKVRKPYRGGRHQESHPSLCDAMREKQYELQDTLPTVRELRSGHPLKRMYFVDNHPYERMIGKTWAHILIQSPVDYQAVDELEKSGYNRLLVETCLECHDMILLEPISTHFYVQIWMKGFWWCKIGVQAFYTLSIVYCCHNPYMWHRNLIHFALCCLAHLWLVGSLEMNPLAKYKMPDRFHDIQTLNQLKYYREFVPNIVPKVVMLFRDEQQQISRPVKIFNALHLLNVFALAYNYLMGIDQWY